MKRVFSGRTGLELRRAARPLGLFLVMLVIAGGVFGIIFKNLRFQRPWQSYTEVKAQFDDVKGIFPKGHQVRIHGVNVGVVKSAKLDHGKAVLTLAIEKKWGSIYRNAKMRIRPVTPLEDLYVNITDRGTPSAGKADTSYTISGDQTITPVDISRVLDTFDADTRERLTVLLNEFGKGLKDRGGDRLKASFVELAPFLHVAEQTTRVMAERRRNLKRLVHNFGTLSGSLARRNTELTGLIRSGDTVFGQLAADQDRLDPMLASLPPLLDSMRTSFVSLRGLAGQLDPALDQLRPVADNLDSGLKGLQQFGTDATPAFRKLRPAIGQLNLMSRTLLPTARNLSTTMRRLRPQAAQYDRLTSELPPCFDSLQRFFSNTLSVTKFKDSYGAFPRAETTVDLDSVDAGRIKNGNTVTLPSCIDKIPAKAHGTGPGVP